MNEWQTALELVLSRGDAPAVLDRSLLSRFARTVRGQSVPASTLTHWIGRTIERERFVRINRGLFLNRFRSIAGRPVDAVHWLRRDAIVSLNTVLGDAGVLNNPSTTVTAIVPLERGGQKPSVGRIKTAVGWFHYFAMPRALLEAGNADDRIDWAVTDHVRATPERALVDWLYLAQSRLSRRTALNPGDLDMELLDLRRLRRLARAVGVEEMLAPHIPA